MAPQTAAFDVRTRAENVGNGMVDGVMVRIAKGDARAWVAVAAGHANPVSKSTPSLDASARLPTKYHIKHLNTFLVR